MWALLSYLFISVPIAALVWFICSLTNYFSAPPCSERRKKAKWALIASSIVAGIIAIIVVGFIYLFFIAIANM